MKVGQKELVMGNGHAAAVSAKVSDNAIRIMRWGVSEGLKLQTNKCERYAVRHGCDGECVTSKSQVLKRTKNQRIVGQQGSCKVGVESLCFEGR